MLYPSFCIITTILMQIIIITEIFASAFHDFTDSWDDHRFLIGVSCQKKISRQLFAALTSYMALPLFAMVFQTFYYGISLVNIAISISMIFLFVVSMVEQNQNLARKEKEAADLRVSIMISQITPHFIYNTLTSIQQMCESDPGQAEETVEEFAEYLRGNLDSLSIKGPVPFERELNHVKCYLAIEKNVLARVSTWFMILKRKSS